MAKRTTSSSTRARKPAAATAPVPEATVEAPSATPPSDGTAPPKKVKIPSPELYRQSREQMESGNTDAAILLALESLEAKRASPAHYEHAARVLFSRGFDTAATLVAQHALDLGLDKAAIHVQLARAVNRKGDHARALEHFDRAVELQPANDGFKRFRDKVAARVVEQAPASEE